MKYLFSCLLVILFLFSTGQAKEEILERVKEVQLLIEKKDPSTQIELDSLGMDIGSFSKRWLSNRNADALIKYYQASIEYWNHLNSTQPTPPLPFGDLNQHIGQSLPKEVSQIKNFQATKPKSKGVRSSVNNLLSNTAEIARITWSLDSARTKYFENISDNLVSLQTQLAEYNENIEMVAKYTLERDSLSDIQKLKQHESLQKSAYLMLIHKFQKEN